MRPINQTVVAGTPLQIPLDIYENPGQVYIDCVPGTGGGTYGVQASNDDPFSGSPPTNFTTNPPIAAATATAAQATITGPTPRQLYVTCTAGSVQVRIVQMGVKG